MKHRPALICKFLHASSIVNAQRVRCGELCKRNVTCTEKGVRRLVGIAVRLRVIGNARTVQQSRSTLCSSTVTTQE